MTFSYQTIVECGVGQTWEKPQRAWYKQLSGTAEE